MKKVICVGGPPMIGKSTASELLACRLGYACVSTDDLGEALRARIKTRELNPFAGRDYREYYISTTVEQLIDDTRIQHRETWPAVKAVIKARSSWGRPLVLEGWNLYPALISELGLDNVAAFWLTASRQLLYSRLKENSTFYSGASDAELLIDNFTARSCWYCSMVISQAADTNQPVIEVGQTTTPEDINTIIIQHLEAAE